MARKFSDDNPHIVIIIRYFDNFDWISYRRKMEPSWNLENSRNKTNPLIFTITL